MKRLIISSLWRIPQQIGLLKENKIWIVDPKAIRRCSSTNGSRPWQTPVCKRREILSSGYRKRMVKYMRSLRRFLPKIPRSPRLTTQKLWNKRCRNCKHKLFTIWVAQLEIGPWIKRRWPMLPAMVCMNQQLPQATAPTTTFSQRDRSRGNLEGL